MNVQVLAVGKLKEPYWKAAQAEYQKRLRPYCDLDIVEVKTGEALAARFPNRGMLVVLDERGEQLTSLEFAELVRNHEVAGQGAPLMFAVGGPDGHDESVRHRADRLVAFGRATIAHRLVRLILLEQIYRSYRIVRGEPYHRE